MADDDDVRHVVFDAVVSNWVDGHVAVTNAVLAVIRDNQQLVDDYLERLAQGETNDHIKRRVQRNQKARGKF